MMHWPNDLKKDINCLTVAVESFLQMTFGLGCPCFMHKLHSIFILDVKVLENWVEIIDVSGLERKVFVDKNFFVRDIRKLWSLLLFILTTSLFFES